MSHYEERVERDLLELRGKVAELCSRFPLYPPLD